MSYLSSYDKVEAHNRYMERLRMRFYRSVQRNATIDMERILEETKSRRGKRRRNAERLKDVEVKHLMRQSVAEFRERVRRGVVDMLHQYEAGVHPDDIELRDPQIAALEAMDAMQAMEDERKPRRRRRSLDKPLSLPPLA